MNIFIFAAIGLTILLLAFLLITYFGEKYYLRFLLTLFITVAYGVSLYLFPNLFLRLFLSLVCFIAVIYQLLFEKRRAQH